MKEKVDLQIRHSVEQAVKEVIARHGLPTEMQSRLAVQGPIDPASAEVRSFHQALKGYRAFVERTGKRNENGQLADSPKNYQDWSKRIEEHHDDFPLWQLKKEKLEEMFAYWVNRPKSKHTGEQVAYDYAKHICDCFWAVLRWLDESTSWKWELPKGADRIKRTPYRLSSDRKKARARRISGSIYSPEQLAIIASDLNTFGKMFLGISVNCGMGPAESGRVEVLDYYVQHPETNAQGDWIVLNRNKTFCYGEWILWPEVARLFRWGIVRAKQLESDLLLVTNKGKPWYKDGSRNATSSMGKWWHAEPCKSDPHEGIVTRLARQREGFPRLTLKTLRKILPSHIRPKYGQELADLANARKIGAGGTVNGLVTDRYADRRYDQLVEAIRELAEDFRPFLDALNVNLEPLEVNENQTQSDAESDTKSDPP